MELRTLSKKGWEKPGINYSKKEIQIAIKTIIAGVGTQVQQGVVAAADGNGSWKGNGSG